MNFKEAESKPLRYKGDKVNKLRVTYHYSNNFTLHKEYWVSKEEEYPYSNLASSVWLDEELMEDGGVFYNSMNYSHFTISKVVEGELTKDVWWEFIAVDKVNEDVVTELN